MFRVLKWLSFGLEAFLAIPFIGIAFIWGHGFLPLIIAFAMHLILWAYRKREGIPATGNMVGMILSFVGWIPVIGWLFHGFTAIWLFIECVIMLIKPSNRPQN